MNASRIRHIVVGVGMLTAAIACGLLAATFNNASAQRAVSSLPDHGLLPDFSLIDHQRQPVTREALSGSVWIADFIFTRCAGQCPLMTAQMATLHRRFAGEPGIRFVSFTVDPVHDTPETLAAYAERSSADTRRWQFITGDPAAVAALARTGFRLGFADDGPVMEPITHSVRFVLVDRQGHVRGYYDATDSEAMKRLEGDARRLIRG